ncbi:MAG: hypothetical protein IVW54_13270 [Candidatus Binataceae bacterium]|nr:hypothetical protein [Candidatus Binataceae bacterium]
MSIWIAVPFAIAIGATVAFSGQADMSEAAALKQMAQAVFGNLSAAESKLLDYAPRRDLAWIGPSSDPSNPSNLAAKASQWGSDRTIRAPLLAWLVSNPEALRDVHPSGIGIAGARIVGPLDLSFMHVGAPITIVNSAVSEGINLSYADTRALDFRRDAIGPVEAAQAMVHGDFTLGQGSYASVDLFRAKVDGDLNFSAGRFHGDGQPAVSAISATIGGDALFHQEFESDGMVDFRLSTIGGSLSFNHVDFIGDGATGLDAERARIGGTLYWTQIAVTPRTILDLEDAEAGAFWDSPESWPAAGHLMLNGFEYKNFGEAPDDAATRLRWLSLQKPGYRSQPFNQLAQVLNNSGREQEAVSVLIAKRDARLRFGGLSVADRIWQFLLKVTIGYGYRPLQALWWMVGFVIFGSILFGWGYRAGLVTPTEHHAYQSFLGGECPAHYPPFNAFVYSLENFLPLVDLHQAAHWRPNPRHIRDHQIRFFSLKRDIGKIEGGALRIYLWAHILSGWILTPLFVAGISGLIHA